ncbi:MAG TPA: PaaI family thioesterase [Bryobacteraceae bacterium]
MTTGSQTQARAQITNRCIVCGEANSRGLHLRFTPAGDGAVRAVWHTDETWEGFRGVVHGGIVSTVLDEAMSKAVAAQGFRALTCELRVRLRQHVGSDEQLEVRGWVVEKRKRRVIAEAALCDTEGRERAHAWGTFLELPSAG